MNSIATLNILLASELTAIHQYIVHAAMVANWGYCALNTATMKRAKTEMKHAAMLLSRILFLGGVPIVSRLNDIQTGPDVQTQFQVDRLAEIAAIRNYMEALATCDDATCVMLRSILADEKDHLDWLETQVALITQIGVKSYLVTQT